MRIDCRPASVAFKLAIVASSTVGVLIQTGVIGGPLNLGALKYFTLLSNILVAIYFAFDAAWTARGLGNPAPRLKGAVVMSIAVTGIVFHTMLSGTAFNMGGADALAQFLGVLGNQLLHTVSPIMATLDWLLFDEKGTYTWKMPPTWVLLADLYFVYATVSGFLLPVGTEGGRFPYPFIDFDLLGWKVIPIVIGLNLGFIAFGYLYVAIDRALAKRAKAA